MHPYFNLSHHMLAAVRPVLKLPCHSCAVQDLGGNIYFSNFQPPPASQPRLALPSPPPTHTHTHTHTNAHPPTHTKPKSKHQHTPATNRHTHWPKQNAPAQILHCAAGARRLQDWAHCCLFLRLSKLLLSLNTTRVGGIERKFYNAIHRMSMRNKCLTN